MKRLERMHGQRGFSLIEMMIATMIFILLCGAAFALLSVAQQRYQTESQVLNSFQEARFGLDEIVRDVDGSGYPPKNSFSFKPSPPPENYYASTPVAWNPGYPNSPCQIGTAGGGTCIPGPSDFDMIIERDVDPWHHDGVEWTRYQLRGTVLSRAQTYKVPGSDPDRDYLACICSIRSKCHEQCFIPANYTVQGGLSPDVSWWKPGADLHLYLP